jgi:dipeptidyl aminopeptidase/acylaminoacyl peptidase
MHTNAEKWLSTLNDAVSFIATQPDVDPKRIGAFGYSLGGYLAVAQSSRDLRIKAVVELAGGVEPAFAKAITRLPPTLIIHGKEDRRVPFSRATELQTLLKKLGATVETLFLAHEQHILTPPAAFQAIATALQFFGTQLPGK